MPWAVNIKKVTFPVVVVLSLVGFLLLEKVPWTKRSPEANNLCCHYSYFSQAEFFDQAYADAKKSAKQPSGIKAILVNHHLLASSYIAEAFNAVATNAPITVLLISPNHFDAGKGNIIASAESWQTPYGILQPDEAAIKKLSGDNLITIEEPPFEQEHGISGIVPFIKKSLPNAKVIPVIFRNRMTLAQSLKAAGEFQKNLPQNTLIVGSFDFSHYLTSRVADFHDIKNLADVENLNVPDTFKLDIDSRPGLAFFLQMLKNSGDQKFTLLEHSNSAKLVHEDILETTSYITGYFQSGAPATSFVETLLSLGSTVPSITPYKFPALTYLDRLFFGQDQTILSNDISWNGTEIRRGAKINSLEFQNGKPIIHADSNLGVGLVRGNNQLQIYLFPIGSQAGQLKLLIGAENDKILAEMAANSRLSDELKNEIKQGIITIQN
jgi:AmmeMemoRadiSam system protein B